MVPSRFCFAAALACSALVSPERAYAQDSEATATALFDSGRKLMAERRYAEACPKLAESQRLAPSGGTLINLAECYEHTGQTASAWAAWKDAAARANAAGKTLVEKNAVARAAALEPSLAKLTIAVDATSDVPGLEVKRDGVPVGHDELGSALPVDPGAHLVEASAPKKQQWSTKVDVLPKQSDARVTVRLADVVEVATPQASAPTATTEARSVLPSPAVPSATSESGSGLGAQKAIALVAGAVGVVGVGVGSAFGLMAMSNNNQALQSCRTPTLCSPHGLSLTSSAQSDASIANVAFGVGAAAVVGGVVLWLTAPRTAAGTAGIRTMPVVGPSYGGLAVDTAW